MTEIKVKNAQEIKEVADLADTTWKEHYRAILRPEQINYMLKKFLTPEVIAAQIGSGIYEYYLLTEDGVPCGFYAIRPEEECLFLSKFYILKDYRGKGYARTVIDNIKQSAGDNQRYIYLTVNRNNPTYKIYQHLGFYVTDTVASDIGEGYVMDDYVMRLDIR